MYIYSICISILNVVTCHGQGLWANPHRTVKLKLSASEATCHAASFGPTRGQCKDIFGVKKKYKGQTKKKKEVRSRFVAVFHNDHC